MPPLPFLQGYYAGYDDWLFEDITDRIVAMGFPSESLEGLYRNNMKDVQKYVNFNKNIIV